MCSAWDLAFRTKTDDDFFPKKDENLFSFSLSPSLSAFRSRCLSNIKLPVLTLILSFYADAHIEQEQDIIEKLIFSLSFTTWEIYRSSCSNKLTENDANVLICSTSIVFVNFSNEFNWDVIELEHNDRLIVYLRNEDDRSCSRQHTSVHVRMKYLFSSNVNRCW